ncbi:MAG: type II toxin-antitoxin system HicA family toxin [Candidatus ainarchaeum sp.]|nr:type II toxin-antitoxin system HicA family toxin [Candidatus ainarchaeum sp.]
MPKPVTPRELIKTLNKLGFQQTRITGSHHRFAHPDGRKVSVPIHGNEPIGTGLMLKIIKQDLKMNKEEFFKLVE